MKISLKILLSLFMVFPVVGFSSDYAVRVLLARPGEPAFDEARHLLYEVYVVEQGWNPKDDPTGLRVEEGAFGPMLVNSYDNNSVRAVAYIGERCVGTLRLSYPIDGKFEVEHYIPLPPLIDGMRAARPDRMLEVNRLAVHADYRSKKVLYWDEKALVADALFDAIGFFRHEYNLFAAPTTQIAEQAGKRWMGMHFPEQYKYVATDPNTVQFVVGLRNGPMGTRLTHRFEHQRPFDCEAFYRYLRATRSKK